MLVQIDTYARINSPKGTLDYTKSFPTIIKSENVIEIQPDELDVKVFNNEKKDFEQFAKKFVWVKVKYFNNNEETVLTNYESAKRLIIAINGNLENTPFFG